MKRAWSHYWRLGAAGLLVSLLLVAYQLRPRDLGRELRLATFQNDLEKVHNLLRQHPELVNQICLNPPKLPPRNMPARASFLEALTIFIWEKVILRPINGPDDREDFSHMEMAQLSPLDIAILRDNPDMARLLLEHGADANRVAGYNRPPLYLAANNPLLATLLIKHGANVNMTNQAHGSPLHAAVHNQDALRVLLEAGADPNAQNRLGMTPLHYVAMSKHLSTNACLLLLQNGARPDITNRSGNTPYDEAVKRNHTDAEKILWEWQTKLATNRPLSTKP